jgi:signal transduction histidine kinase
VHNSVSAIREANGEVRSLVVLSIDITERKRVEDALLRSEDKYRHIFETAATSIFEEDWTAVRHLLDLLYEQGVVDLRAYVSDHPDVVTAAIPLVKIVDVNEYTLRLFKAPSKEALLGSLDMIFVPETTAVFKEELIAVWEGRDIYECQAPMRTIDGRPLSVLFTLTVPKQDADWPRVMVTLTDVTALHQAENELRRAQERLQRWNIELEQTVNAKTTALQQSEERLRALASELNLAEQRERKRLATELHDHLQQMLVVGKLAIGQGKRVSDGRPEYDAVLKRVDDILSDALTYSRTLVAELSPPVLRDHGLTAALKWLAEYMKKKHEQRVMVILPDDDGVMLPEDQRVLLFQSVRELLINASKHAGTGTATIRMTRHADQVQIEVHDDGQGFDLAAAAAAAAGNPGGGISSKFGLYSIQERMKALGGSFSIRSMPGEGTTATLTLPPARSAEIKVLSPALSPREDVTLRTQASGLQKKR